MAEGQVRGSSGDCVDPRSFLDLKDSQYISGLIEEHMGLGNPPFAYYKLDAERSQYDHNRKEVVRPVYADEPEQLLAWIESNPSEKTLKSVGVQKSRELLIITSKAFLARNEIVLGYGDIIVVFGEEYYIWETNEPSNGWFGFHTKHLRSATCMRKFRSSTKDSGPFDDQQQADQKPPETQPVPDDWNV